MGVSSLQSLREAVRQNGDANILLRRRRYRLLDVTRLRATVQIYGLTHGESRKYNYQVAEVVKELESGWATVMLLEPTFDRKLLLLSPLNLVPYIDEKSDKVVSIASNSFDI